MTAPHRPLLLLPLLVPILLGTGSTLAQKLGTTQPFGDPEGSVFTTLNSRQDACKEPNTSSPPSTVGRTAQFEWGQNPIQGSNKTSWINGGIQPLSHTASTSEDTIEDTAHLAAVTFNRPTQRIDPQQWNSYSLPPMLENVIATALLILVLYSWWHGRISLRLRLFSAMQRKHIHVEYQPLIKLASGTMVGVEALARWTHATAGSIPPDQFFQWAESIGAGRLLTRYITRAALTGIRKQLQENDDFYVSINVSPRDIEKASFLKYLLDLVAELNLSPGQIVLEITESSAFLVEDPRAMLNRYREAGFPIFIDDFGTGHSNLTNLLDWEIDCVKVAGSLVRSTHAHDTNSKAEAILNSVIEITRKLNIPVLVEGIETEAQAHYVLLCAPEALGQGWLFGRSCLAHQLSIAALRAKDWQRFACDGQSSDPPHGYKNSSSRIA